MNNSQEHTTFPFSSIPLLHKDIPNIFILLANTQNFSDKDTSDTVMRYNLILLPYKVNDCYKMAAIRHIIIINQRYFFSKILYDVFSITELSNWIPTLQDTVYKEEGTFAYLKVKLEIYIKHG